MIVTAEVFSSSISVPIAVAFGSAMFPSAATSLPFGILNSAANIMQTIDPRLTQATVCDAYNQVQFFYYQFATNCLSHALAAFNGYIPPKAWADRM